MRETRALIERLKASRPYTAWKRYGDANGDLLAAGVGYFAFFSVFPALALAFAAFGFVLRGRPELLDSIAEYLNGVLPGMVRTADNPEGVIGLTTPQTSTLTITSVISVATLLMSGLGWIGALRSGIRGIFGVGAPQGNAITSRLRDVGVLLSLGVGIAASAILTSVVGGLAAQLAGWIGAGVTEGAVAVVGLLLGVAFDFVLMAFLLRLLAGVSLSLRQVRDAALVGAVVLTLLKYFGGLLIARATSNPLLGAVVVAVGLLFWLNLMSRVTLLSAAWAANDAGVVTPGALPSRGAAVERAYVAPAPATPYAAGPGARATRSRAVDRVSLAAGAVLGALGALGAVLALGARRFRGRS